MTAWLVTVLVASCFSGNTSAGRAGYGGWSQPQWPNPTASELREVADGQRDGAALVTGALESLAVMRQKWHTDSTMRLQAAAPTRWGYWSQDGYGWPMAWWWHICYPNDGKTGRRFLRSWEWSGESLQLAWFDATDASDHALNIHPFNIFLSLWCVGVVWLAAWLVLRRSLRTLDRWMLFLLLVLILFKASLLPRVTFGTVGRDYIALERWPDASAPLCGPELTLAELEHAATSDATGQTLARALMQGVADPPADNAMVRWQLIPMTRAWGTFTTRSVGWPWPLLTLRESTAPAPTVGAANTRPVEGHWSWWRGPEYAWGTIGFPSANTTLSLPMGSLALHATALVAIWWAAGLACRWLSAGLWRHRFRQGSCVACGYLVRPPVLGAAHPPTSPALGTGR